MKKLVVFDLDGTLVDSIADLGDAVNFALGKFSLPLHTIEEYNTFVGNGMEDLVRRSMGAKGQDDELYKKIRKVFDAYYNAHCNDKTIAYDGVDKLLENLREKGVKTAVFTNKAHVYIHGIVEKCFPNHKFDLEFGQQQGVERKPSAQGMAIIMNSLGVTPDECLYIGDSEVDVQTAKNAGVDLVAVLWGYRSKAELLKSGAAELVSTPAEILGYINDEKKLSI